MVWIRRSVMTFNFRGEKRGLFWRKEVYKIWYEYAKVSPRNIPPEFGDLSKFKNFEEWWKTSGTGVELFFEPAEEIPLEVVKSIESSKDKDIIYLRVNLNSEPHKLKRMFNTVLNNHQNPKHVVQKSQARFQPSVDQKHMKIDALKRYLENWKMRQKGMSRRDIYKDRYHTSQKVDVDVLRTISREYQRAKEIFKNIERGTFP